jgi:predicted protein tyrosine phosphatase
MRVCDFDGTETELSVCPTCNDYKGLTTAEEKRTFGMISLDQAITNAMNLMDEAREHHLNTHTNDCDCDYRAGEE